MPANVFLKFFMVSSASSVRVWLRDPWRVNPPRPPAEPGAAVAVAEVALVPVAVAPELGAADADDTDDVWETDERKLEVVDMLIALCIG